MDHKGAINRFLLIPNQLYQLVRAKKPVEVFRQQRQKIEFFYRQVHKRDGPVSLSGEWEFYWEQLLTPQDFRGERRPAATRLANLPELWNSYQIPGENDTQRLTGDGYATYRLLVKSGQSATPWP